MFENIKLMVKLYLKAKVSYDEKISVAVEDPELNETVAIVQRAHDTTRKVLEDLKKLGLSNFVNTEDERFLTNEFRPDMMIDKETAVMRENFMEVQRDVMHQTHKSVV